LPMLLVDALPPLVEKDVDQMLIEWLSSSWRLGGMKAILEQLQWLRDDAKLHEVSREWNVQSPELLKFARGLMAWSTPSILDAVDVLVVDCMSGVGYLAPIRSEGGRAHRLMDLAVEEVDPRGENLAMFLKSLSRDEMCSLGEFTKEHLGFSPGLRIQGMQAEI